MGRRGEDNKDEVAFDYTLLCAQAKNLLEAYWAMDKKPAPCSSHPEVQLDLQSNELAKRLQDSITSKTEHLDALEIIVNIETAALHLHHLLKNVSSNFKPSM